MVATQTYRSVSCRAAESLGRGTRRLRWREATATGWYDGERCHPGGADVNGTIQRGNYRRGGFFLLAGSGIGLLAAYLAGAPLLALGTIALFGLGGAAALILVGDRRAERVD